MPLASPNLDDRNFEQLLRESLERLDRICPEWTDRSPGDPGMALLELFAHLTETLLYRMNRLPDKVYIELLRLIGVQLLPPTAAGVEVTVRRLEGGNSKIEIPRGTRLTVDRVDGGGEPPVFTTTRPLTLEPGSNTGTVVAYNVEWVQAELAGVGTGLPGQSVIVRHTPMVARTGTDLDLVVGIEEASDRIDPGAAVVTYGGKMYRIWREVQNFTFTGNDRHVYIADRSAGRITFAPALSRRATESEDRTLADVPQAGSEIRTWYSYGGGPAGNVASGRLTVLKDVVPGVEVVNDGPATGGKPAETLPEALARGPQELHSLHRAVTARDFEMVALDQGRGAVARAKAIARAEEWRHAIPGTAEVLLVPEVPSSERGVGLSADVMRTYENESARASIEGALEQRRPLGTKCVVSWARYKSVKVTATIGAHQYEDAFAVRDRVFRRLHEVISPLPVLSEDTGWPFGEALRVSVVYETALSDPGVRWVEDVRLLVEDVPEQDVATIAVDHHQPHTWYAASGGDLFRSLDDGAGWESIRSFSEAAVRVVRSHPERAGVIAVATESEDAKRSHVYMSEDCGETWSDIEFALEDTRVHDAAWVQRDGVPVLLIATGNGLYELSMTSEALPIQILVDPQDQNLGFYAVAAATDLTGIKYVAVAAEETKGAYVSRQGGAAETFRRFGLDGKDVRILQVERDGTRLFLWAGAAAVGREAGPGCFRRELRESLDSQTEWQQLNDNWKGGSCTGIAFVGDRLIAGTHRAGVQWLTPSQRSPTWSSSEVSSGLPLRDTGTFEEIESLAANGTVAMIGGTRGVYRSVDAGGSFDKASNTEFDDKVTLPANWLFCSAEHEIRLPEEE